MKRPSLRTLVPTGAALFAALLLLLSTGGRSPLTGGAVPAMAADTQDTQGCLQCHQDLHPGIVGPWESSTHRSSGTGCYECHQAESTDADAFDHYGAVIATIVTPMDCARCHGDVAEEFAGSHHAKGGNILASLDNFLAETVEGSRTPFSPHSPTPGMDVDMVNGLASVNTGCAQCHGSKIALKTTDGGKITVDDLAPDEQGRPTNTEVLERIARDDEGRPILHTHTWPNTGIGRINLDGSLGSCTACHSRHDFSRRRARQPENCGKCHLGPDHPQKEIYEESKHGVAYRDLKDQLDLDNPEWILGQDYVAAPTCATCHMSGNVANGGRITHDPGERISWTNRPYISRRMDTDENNEVVTATDPAVREERIYDSADAKRKRMKQVCTHCHSTRYVDAFYTQYDDFVILYNEKFGKPGNSIMTALRDQGLLTDTQFDEEIEWTWFYLWHHEGRRARHGAAMMAPDYAHWHGMYEVAERFYQELIPQARELAEHARSQGKTSQADAVEEVISEIMSRAEHDWMPE